MDKSLDSLSGRLCQQEHWVVSPSPQARPICRDATCARAGHESFCPFTVSRSCRGCLTLLLLRLDGALTSLRLARRSAIL